MKLLTGRVGKWPNNIGGGVWTGKCERFSKTSGESKSNPFEVCDYYGKTKLSLSMKETSTFVRYNASSFDTVCFYFKKKDVAGLLEENAPSEVAEEIQNIQKQIEKTEGYIAKEQAFADAINEYKLSEAIKKQGKIMSKVSGDRLENEMVLVDALHAIKVHEELLEIIKSAPAAPNPSVWVGKKAFTMSVLGLAARLGKKVTAGLGAAAAVIAIPLEKIGKEHYRQKYIDKTMKVLQDLNGAKLNIESAIASAEDKFWAAHRVREGLRSELKVKEKYERNVWDAMEKIRALQFRQNDLATGRKR